MLATLARGSFCHKTIYFDNTTTTTQQKTIVIVLDFLSAPEDESCVLTPWGLRYVSIHNLSYEESI